MGVCGYTYSEVQEMPIDALARAIHSKKRHDAAPWNALFTAFGGTPGSTAETPKVSPREGTIALFDALFA